MLYLPMAIGMSYSRKHFEMLYLPIAIGNSDSRNIFQGIKGKEITP
jgi:hypothetical protein